MGHQTSFGHGFPCRVFVTQSAGAGYHQKDRGTGSTSEYADQLQDCGEAEVRQATKRPTGMIEEDHWEGEQLVRDKVLEQLVLVENKGELR